MDSLRTLVAVLTGFGTLAAQSVQATIDALTPLTAQVSDGAATHVISVPPGPLGWGGTMSIYLPNAPSEVAGLDYRVEGTNQYVSAILAHGVFNPGGLSNFSGRVGPQQYMVTFLSTIPRTATLTISRQLELAAGAPAPILQIDIDNDGVIDIANPSTTTSTSLPVSFGPLQKQVRVVVDVTLNGQLAVWDQLTLRLVPDNNLVVTQPVGTCSPPAIPQPPMVQASFDDRGVNLLRFSTAPSVFVLGLSAQPGLLAVNGPLPCILLPSVDVVLPATFPLHVPLPASVRPATFFAQGVSLEPGGLRTSDGFCVQAN